MHLKWHTYACQRTAQASCLGVLHQEDGYLPGHGVGGASQMHAETVACRRDKEALRGGRESDMMVRAILWL